MQEIKYIEVPYISDIEDGQVTSIVDDIPIVEESKTRKCCDCGLDKVLKTDYYVHHSCTGGFQKRCKECHTSKYLVPINTDADSKNKIRELRDEISKKNKEMKEAREKAVIEAKKNVSFIYKYSIEVTSDNENDLVNFIKEKNLTYKKLKTIKPLKE
jgi:hypothetical protein